MASAASRPNLSQIVVGTIDAGYGHMAPSHCKDRALPTRKGSLPHPIFTVQKHGASHLHYDLRLEAAGVLKSWAIPKGPSLDPHVKRLAIAVEDHDLAYADFEGVIEEHRYGAGPVLVWDIGRYELLDQSSSVQRQLKEGQLDVVLFGRRLKGGFTLVRFAGRVDQWLLIKQKDEASRTDGEVTDRYTTSVLTGVTLEDLEANVHRASSGSSSSR